MSNWVTIVPMSGTNNYTATITFDANTGDTSRQVTVIGRTRTGSGTSTLIFTQNGQLLIISPMSKIVTSALTTFNITVEANISYNITKDVNWITLNSYSGVSGISQFTVTVAENNDEQERYGHLTIANKTITIKQLYNNYSIQFTYNPIINQYVNSGDSWGAEVIEVIKNNGNGEVVFTTAPTIIPFNGFSYYGFTNGQDLYSITIPDSIIEIKSNAFRSNRNLTSVILPNNLIKLNGFSYTGLISINIPDSVEYLEDGAFKSTPLQNVSNIKAGLKSWQGAFEYCSSLPVDGGIRYADTIALYAVDSGLTSCTIKNGTLYIGNSTASKEESSSVEGYTFEKCKGIHTVVLPESLTEIGDYTFSTTQLASINFPNSIIKIGNSAFQNCSGLTSISMPSSLQEIGRNAFYFYPTVTSNIECTISIPNTVTKIGERAFSGCNKLTISSLSNNIQEIYTSSFYNCKGTEINNVYYVPTANGNKSYVIRIVNTGDTSYEPIPSNAFIIGDGAYSSWSGFTSNTVIIPSGVTNIGTDAFNSSVIHNLTLNNGLKVIGDRAFYNNNISNELTIPSTVTSIGTQAFYMNQNLPSVKFENPYIDIANDAFSSCTSLPTINNIKYSSTNVNDNPVALYVTNTILSSYTIESSTVNFARSIFIGCTNIQTSGNVKYTSLISSDNPATVECTVSGAELFILNGTKYILSYSLQGNGVRQTAVHFPSSIKLIQNASCDTRTYYYDGTMAEWGMIIKENNWSTIGGIVHCSDGDVAV